MVSVKRFLVFAGENHYPLGGWDDFAGAFDSHEEADVAKKHKDEKGHWAQIVDLWEEFN